MKGRQSQGDMLAIMPYPTKPPTKPEEKKKGGGGESKAPQAPPAWSTFMPMGAPLVGMPRPLPNAPGLGMPVPFGAPAMNLGGALPLPGMGPERPLPKV
jgi:hypothetical protein